MEREMPAGDPQRKWFPKMLERLRIRWHADMSFEQLVELAGELDSMLHRIRPERHILSSGAGGADVLGQPPNPM